MKSYKTYLIIGCLFGGLFFSSCAQEEELNDFEKIALERPTIEAYAAEQGLDGVFNFQGVYVVTQAEGDTATSFATSSSFVDLAYVGALLDGKVFSDTNGEGLRTPGGELPRLSNLIPGLESGVKLFRKGGSGTLIIPSPLAYEEFGSTDGQIPPDAILRFDFELLDIQ